MTLDMYGQGAAVGSRLQFEEMNVVVEANESKPAFDEKMFKVDHLKDAYQYWWNQKHFEKLVLDRR